MNRRTLLASMLLTVMVLAVSGCEQLAELSGSKSRIKGDWYLVIHSFKEDEVYNFAEGMIIRDGVAWGTYKFTKNTIIEVAIGGQTKTLMIEFPDDERMLWYEIVEGVRNDRYEWKRE